MTQEKPMVLVYTGDDDPSRGDVHGSIGVGKKIAGKIGGEFHYLEDKDLAALYPEKTKAEALKQYFNEHGKPDVLLSKFWRVYDPALGKHKPLVLFNDNNEYLSTKYLGEQALVTHHLTPDILAAEGKKFRAAYPDLPSPLIAVMMVNIKDIDGFAEKLASKAAAHPQAAIFVTGCRRTTEENFGKLMEALEKRLQIEGAADRVRILGYNHKKKPGEAAPFNPYAGLLNEADHVIVAGDSYSLLSEPLAAGKRSILFEGFKPFESLEQKGLITQFNKAAARAPFESSKITPFNPTDAIVEKMVEEYRKKDFWRKLNPARLVRKALGR